MGSGLRFAVLGLSHESNSFAPGYTGRARIEAAGVLRGRAVLERHRGGTSTMSGFLDIEGDGVEVVPLLHTFPTPGPVIERAAFEALCDEMARAVAEEGPWDGVLLAQHGAAIAEGVPDTDAVVTRRVAAAAGGVPVGLAVDMHANLSPALIGSAAVLVSYRTNPHLDARERAYECASLLARVCRGQVRPTSHLSQVPVVIGIAAQHTSREPMAGILEELRSVLGQAGVLTGSVTEGYPYGDVPDLGMAALVTTDDDPGLAAEAAGRLARRIWECREAMDPPVATVAQAVRQALASRHRPVLLLDSGDNIGGGSGGDSTAIIEETVRQGLHPTLVLLNDPGAVALCRDVAPGGRVALEVGGRVERGSPPLAVSGTLAWIGPGAFTGQGAAHAGLASLDPGETAVVATDAGDTIVLTSLLVMPTSLEQLHVLGVRPGDHRAIVAKGVQSPRPAYEPISGEVIVVGSPGATTLDLRSLPYRARRRPLWPFEEPEQRDLPWAAG